MLFQFFHVRLTKAFLIFFSRNTVLLKMTSLIEVGKTSPTSGISH